MSNIRTSPIWKLPSIELKEIISQCKTMTEALKYFGLMNKGSNFKTLKKRLIEEDISYSHFDPKSVQREALAKASAGAPLEELLVINSTVSRGSVKRRIIKEGLVEYKCAICGQLPEWNGKPLTLQIDHINGISNDNRIENLRILCGHCHSQTDNFAGKNLKYENYSSPEGELSRVEKPTREIPKSSCKDCGADILQSSLRCKSCKGKSSTRITYPDIDSLIEMIQSSSYTAIAAKLGVSDNAIKKHLRNRGALHLIKNQAQKARLNFIAAQSNIKQ